MKYQDAVERWKKQATGKGLEGFPVEATKFALYLQHLGEVSNSRAAVELAVNAVAWMQRLTG